MLPLEVTPEEVKRRLDAREPLHLVDVREPAEFALCHIEGAQPVPLASIPAALKSLRDKAASATVILFCHHGIRSLQAASWLRGQGLPACQSMQGGIHRWSALVDPSVPQY